jgi:hypothetical protein
MPGILAASRPERKERPAVAASRIRYDLESAAELPRRKYWPAKATGLLTPEPRRGGFMVTYPRV